jgi:hypothetical protein
VGKLSRGKLSLLWKANNSFARFVKAVDLTQKAFDVYLYFPKGLVQNGKHVRKSDFIHILLHIFCGIEFLVKR